MRIITITGPSASGKSSLAKSIELISKFYKKLDSSEFFSELEKRINDSIRDDVISVVDNNFSATLPMVKEAVSYTTRGIRPGEIDGIDYNFVTVDEFNALELYDSTCYSGNYYGLGKDSIHMPGIDIAIAVVDQAGAKNIKKNAEKYGDVCTNVFISVTPENVLERITKRGDSQEVIEKRIKLSMESNEFSFPEADVIIDNSQDFKSSLQQVLNLLKAD